MLASATNLTHHYGHDVVYNNLTFTLTPGVTALVGINGSGKTTLMRTMATLLKPTSGDFALRGEPSEAGDARSSKSALTRQRSLTALMPQIFSAPSGIRVVDFLSYVGWLRAIPRAVRQERVSQVLAEVDLGDRAGSKFSTLSGGMVRRVNLAQALIGRPQLLLLDEPTEGLDPEQRIRIRELVRACGKRSTVLMSSHLMEDVVHVADRILVLHEGGIVFDGDAEHLAAQATGRPATKELSIHEAAFLELTRRNG